MSEKKPTALLPTRGARDPLSLLRQMTSELDRAFEDWPSFGWPSFGRLATSETVAWSPKIDVFERDNRLVTRVDLPGMKKEDVSVVLSRPSTTNIAIWPIHARPSMKRNVPRWNTNRLLPRTMPGN